MTGKLFDKIKKTSDRFELRLSGSGGQGMIFASVVLGEALFSHSRTDRRPAVERPRPM